VRVRLEQVFSAAVLDFVEEWVRAVIREELENEHERNGEASKKWLTTEEAAERLGCTPKAIRERIYRGRLEARYQGRRVYVSADSVDDL
jgi:excisionase family DNA binding protein